MKKPKPKTGKQAVRSRVARSAKRAAKPAVKPLARGSLSQELILQAALEIADREGLASLTLRKIATILDASPMAIYRHFRNKAALVAKLPDRVVGIYAVTEHATPDWQEWIVVTLLRMRAGLLEHPGVIPLLGSSATAGPNAFSVMDRFLAVLRAAGIADADATQLFHILMSYTVGAVAVESAASQRMTKRAAQRKAPGAALFFESAVAPEYSNLVALAPHLAGFASEEFFAAGVRRIVVAFAPAAPTNASRTR